MENFMVIVSQNSGTKENEIKLFGPFDGDQRDGLSFYFESQSLGTLDAFIFDCDQSLIDEVKKEDKPILTSDEIQFKWFNSKTKKAYVKEPKVLDENIIRKAYLK